MMPLPKKRSAIKPAVYGRYGVLCAVELVALALVLVVVRQWTALPGWLFGGIVAAWIVKDVVLFPFVWRAYDPEAPGVTRSGGMTGARGIAREVLDPCGYVQVRGELWKAERADGSPPIAAGSRVRVVRREGLTLFVTAEDAGAEKKAPAGPTS